MPTLGEILDLAVQHHQSGNLPQAEALYRQVLQADPGHADSRHLLGVLAHQCGHQDAAVTLIRQAIAVQPAVATFHYNLGTVYQAQGLLADAIECYRQALQIDPNHAGAYHNMGTALAALGRLTEAIESFRQGLRINTRNADGHYNLGLMLVKQGELAEAVSCFREATRLNPSHVNAFIDLGTALRDRGELAQAALAYREALRVNPNNARAHYYLGSALAEQGELAGAIDCYQRALQIDPNLADAHCNLGNALKESGLPGDAEACYVRALNIDPRHTIARWNRSFMRLLHGDFAAGWTDFEERWVQPGRSARVFQQPRWDGSPLDGRTVLVHAEQGLGDTIQFVRYLPMVQQRGGKVLFECQSSLVRMLTDVSGAGEIVPRDEPLPPFDLHIPLLSLPRLLGTTLANIPAQIPYLAAEPELVRFWRDRVGQLRGLKIGIAWQGDSKHANDRYRSVPLARFEPLAKLKGIQLISLQKGNGTGQLQQWTGGITTLADIRQHDAQPRQLNPIVDLGEALDAAGAFVDTAAVLMSLDLVISADSAVAHLAGALGVPVWVALSVSPDWRWLLDREESPWYPTMRLFRQRRLGDWDDVFETMALELRKLIAAAR